MARNPTKSRQTFYGYSGEIATLGFHELRGEQYRECVEARENLECVKITKDEDGQERSFLKTKIIAYSSVVRTLEVRGIEVNAALKTVTEIQVTISVVVEEDDGGEGRFESQVKECQSALLKHQQRGLVVRT